MIRHSEASSKCWKQQGVALIMVLLAQPGYRAGNQKFSSVTELRLLEGMTEEAYQTLRPFVAALPVSGLGINVNTASAEVLRTLHADLSAAQVNAVIEVRKEQRFESIKDFLALPQFSGLGLKSEGLTLQTRFFEVVARITYDKRVVHMVSTVYRDLTLSGIYADASLLPPRADGWSACMDGEVTMLLGPASEWLSVQTANLSMFLQTLAGPGSGEAMALTLYLAGQTGDEPS